MVERKSEVCSMCGDEICPDEPTIIDWLEGRVHLDCSAEMDDAADFEMHWGA